MQVKALKDCHYGGPRKAGETFDVTGQYGYLMARMGMVKVLGDSVETKAMQAETPEEKPKRTYKRKDMAGEGITK